MEELGIVVVCDVFVGSGLFGFPQAYSRAKSLHSMVKSSLPMYANPSISSPVSLFVPLKSSMVPVFFFLV